MKKIKNAKYYNWLNKRQLNPYSVLFNNNNNNKGGSQFIHIPNYGKRKIRYQKNGKAYVIVKGKKLKLN